MYVLVVRYHTSFVQNTDVITDLVWEAILDNISSLLSTWYENEEIVERGNAFRRALLSPLVEKLGYEYPEGESANTSQLRTLVIATAANAKHEGYDRSLSFWIHVLTEFACYSVIGELKHRFAEFQKTGDESIIPADLVRATYATAVREGGREEYQAMKQIQENPKNPAQRIAAMYVFIPRKLACYFAITDKPVNSMALGASPDPKIARETLEYASEKARDQDLIYFFTAVGSNMKTRRVAGEFFKENYEAVCLRIKFS
jgi:aminopeptidase 2